MPEPAFTKLVNEPNSPPKDAATAVATTFAPTAPDEVRQQQRPARSAQRQQRRRTFRGGFSTSICDFFSQPSRRTDCCSLACCGVLSADRNRYLLNNELPPPWWRRILINVCLPLFIYLTDQAVVGYITTEKVTRECKYAFPDSGVPPGPYDAPPDLSDLDSLTTLHWVLALLLIGTATFLLVRAASKRKEFRTEFIDKLFQRDRGEEVSSSQILANRILHKVDTSMATRTCGCCFRAPDLNYIVELRSNNDVRDDLGTEEMDRDEGGEDDGEDGGGDLCGWIWNFVRSLCCGACCGCWCQCCGMCATGQEEREINMMMPREEKNIDYVTFEPYINYFPTIENLRRMKDGSFAAHYGALSRLAVSLIKAMGIILVLLLLFALTDIDSKFTFENMLVVLATFLQAFLILYFVHWRWHRLDISLDAVVKYFACGFIFSTSSAIVIEMLVSFAVAACVAVLGFIAVLFEAGTLAEQSDPNEMAKTFIKDNVWLGVLFMFLNAFVVAALIEELCKYFGFWMVEHPDLLLKQEGTEVSESTSDQLNSNEDNYQLNTPFSIGDAEEEADGDGDAVEQTDANGKTSNSQQSLNSMGVGITIGMVTAATGFACCENLKYVFSTSDVKTELMTLLFRSLVPVHALAAAIQSIGVCRRDLEGNKAWTLGRCILPAVLLHGSFDFFLMVTPVLMIASHADEFGEDDETSEEDKKYNAMLEVCKKYDAVNEEVWKTKGGYKEDDEQLSTSDIVILGTTFGLTVLSVLIGIVYYVVGSRKQKARLEDLEIARRQNAREDSTRGLV